MARTRHHEAVTAGGGILAVWAVAGPTVGLLVGLAIGHAAWGGRRAEVMKPEAAPVSPSEAKEEAPAPEPPERGAAQKPGAGTPPKPAADTAAERDWLRRRGLPRPLAAYLFSKHTRFRPLGGFVLGKGCSLTASGPVSIGPEGAEFRDGGKLLSLPAGRILSEQIKRAGAFSLEAFVCPADTRHAGPARIVSISYDGSFRNVTLCQERATWHVRLRQSSRNLNGTSPDVRVKGLAVRWTHVVVTYDGRRERVFLDGREAAASTAVAGDLTSWNTKRFALVLGNEANAARNWAGKIAFVAFYGTALDSAQAARAYAAAPPGLRMPAPGATRAHRRQDVF